MCSGVTCGGAGGGKTNIVEKGGGVRGCDAAKGCWWGKRCVWELIDCAPREVVEVGDRERMLPGAVSAGEGSGSYDLVASAKAESVETTGDAGSETAEMKESRRRWLRALTDDIEARVARELRRESGTARVAEDVSSFDGRFVIWINATGGLSPNICGMGQGCRRRR